MGCLNKLRAEIIPNEPDPDNAGEGRAKRALARSIG